MQQVGSAINGMPVVFVVLLEPIKAYAQPMHLLMCCCINVAVKLQMKEKPNQFNILCGTKSSGWCMQMGLPPCVAQESQ